MVYSLVYFCRLLISSLLLFTLSNASYSRNATNIGHHDKHQFDTSIDAPDAQIWKMESGTAKGLLVMTFNIWQSGNNVENGMEKIAKHISRINPDIVGLQEVNSISVLKDLVHRLGPDWSYIGRDVGSPTVAVLTRHTILGPSPLVDVAVRAKIRIQYSDGSDTIANFWSVHFYPSPYGPYAACDPKGTTASQIEASEQGRIQNLRNMANVPEFNDDLERANEELMIVVGDLNCPSHLDWVESTKSSHCGWAYEWPVTKALSGYGMVDAFREIHPNPAAAPGNTWSPVIKSNSESGGKIGEPQDRIDMIFYKSTMWASVSAKVYTGSEPITPSPDYHRNDWPSDHASVVVELKEK